MSTATTHRVPRQQTTAAPSTVETQSLENPALENTQLENTRLENTRLENPTIEQSTVAHIPSENTNATTQNGKSSVRGRVIKGVKHSYTILEQLAGGSEGFATVSFKAESEGQLYVLKGKTVGLMQDPYELWKMTKDVSEALTNLNQPGLVTDTEVLVNGPYVINVRPWIQGKTLDEIVTTQQFNAAETREFGTNIAKQLGGAHSKNIIHRDIKPNNIIRSADGDHLIDFGVAKKIERAEDPDEDENLTNMTIVGTPAYRAPEIMFGRADARADIYSLGHTLLYTLTGKHPIKAGTEEQKYDYTRKAINKLNIDDALKETLCVMTNPDKASRYKTMDEVIAALSPESVMTAISTENTRSINAANTRVAVPGLGEATNKNALRIAKALEARGFKNGLEMIGHYDPEAIESFDLAAMERIEKSIRGGSMDDLAGGEIGVAMHNMRKDAAPLSITRPAEKKKFSLGPVWPFSRARKEEKTLETVTATKSEKTPAETCNVEYGYYFNKRTWYTEVAPIEGRTLLGKRGDYVKIHGAVLPIFMPILGAAYVAVLPFRAIKYVANKLGDLLLGTSPGTSSGGPSTKSLQPERDDRYNGYFAKLERATEQGTLKTVMDVVQNEDPLMGIAAEKRASKDLKRWNDERLRDEKWRAVIKHITLADNREENIFARARQLKPDIDGILENGYTIQELSVIDEMKMSPDEREKFIGWAEAQYKIEFPQSKIEHGPYHPGIWREYKRRTGMDEEQKEMIGEQKEMAYLIRGGVAPGMTGEYIEPISTQQEKEHAHLNMMREDGSDEAMRYIIKNERSYGTPMYAAAKSGIATYLTRDSSMNDKLITPTPIAEHERTLESVLTGREHSRARTTRDPGPK